MARHRLLWDVCVLVGYNSLIRDTFAQQHLFCFYIIYIYYVFCVWDVRGRFLWGSKRSGVLFTMLRNGDESLCLDFHFMLRPLLQLY
jgi:hypothetical protein